MSKQSNQQESSQPEARYRKHRVRAISRGFANNMLHDEGDEFDYVIVQGITPPSWVEILDEGEPVDEIPNLNANDFAKEEIQRRRGGFANGQPL